MSLHRSLKTKSGALNQHRNVLTRAERIAKLAEQGRFVKDDNSPLGLVKVASRKVATKKKKAAKEGEEGAEGATAPAAGAAPAAAAAPAAKPAAKPADKKGAKK